MLTREKILEDPKGALLEWSEEVRAAGRAGSLAVNSKCDEFDRVLHEMHPDPEVVEAVAEAVDEQPVPETPVPQEPADKPTE